MIKIYVKTWKLIPAIYKNRAFYIFFLMLIGAFLEMLGVGLIIPILGYMVNDQAPVQSSQISDALESLEIESREQILSAMMMCLGATYVLKNLFLLYMNKVVAKYTNDIRAHLSEQLFTSYLFKPYTFHLESNSAVLIQNVAQEIVQFTVSILTPCFLLLAETFVLVALLGVLLVSAPLETLVVVVVMGVTLYLLKSITGRRVSELGKSRKKSDAARLKQLKQTIECVKDIKVFNREHGFLQRYHEVNVKTSKVNEQYTFIQQIPRLFLESITIVSVAIFVIFSLKKGASPKEVLPILGLFTATAFRILPSVARILVHVQSIHYGSPIVSALEKEIVPIFETDPSLRFRSNRALKLDTEIAFTNVAYTYPNSDKQILKDINLTIKKGETVGIVGSSGAGKSTLVDILMGLLKPTAGTFSVNGVNVEGQEHEWRNNIGYVPQSYHLLDDNIIRNVAFGLTDTEISDEKFHRAIHKAKLAQLIESRPELMTKTMGENGAFLSGGQKQRISIARALYHDPDIIIFDEATSSLDPETEMGILDPLSDLKGEKTLIMITHRLSSLNMCDKVYKVTDGQLESVR